MIASYAAIFFLGASLAWAAVNRSGVAPFDLYVSLVLIGAATVTYWGRERRLVAPPLKPWLRWTILAVLLYMAFQLVPLPLSLLTILSPARVELARALAPVTGSHSFAPISVSPPADLLWFLTIIGCVATFFLVREIASRFSSQPGLVLMPLLALAAFEAILGLMQISGGAAEATGTYNGRDHYVCLLELALPVTIAYGIALFTRPGASSTRNQTGEVSVVPALAAVGIWLLATIQLLATLASLSRAGILDTLIALVALGLLLLLPRLPSNAWRAAVVGALFAGLATILAFASPAALLQRLADTDTQSEGRLLIWREALPMLKEFPWVGTGLMGFDPTFLKYQNIVNAKRIDFAHNDFLQYSIELGAIGFIPLMAAVGGVVGPIASKAWNSRRSEQGVLSAGCIASLLALACHSLVDFNLYVPANILALAWIMGFGSVYAVAGGRDS